MPPAASVGRVSEDSFASSCTSAARISHWLLMTQIAPFAPTTAQRHCGEILQRRIAWPGRTRACQLHPSRPPEAKLKKNWSLTTDSFHRLLHWLDEGGDSGGEAYLAMRQRLLNYFDRKNCLTPDNLADETMNRVARRLEEGGLVAEIPAKFCYSTARFVFLEELRTQSREREFCGTVRAEGRAGQENTKEQEAQQRRLACLEKCMAEVEPAQRELVLRYYHGTQRAKIENRRAQAAELGLTPNALAIRACRIREQLEQRVRQCLADAERIL